MTRHPCKRFFHTAAFHSFPLKSFCLPLLVFLFTAPLFAKVFMRLRSSSADFLKATGGYEIYDAKASVNGKEAIISVLGFDRPLYETASSIRSFWKLPRLKVETSPEFNGAWLTKTGNGQKQTLLLLPGNSAGTCSAWLVETSDREDPGDLPPPPDGNPLPSADLTSWIENQSSKTVLTVHETTATPSACLAEGSEYLQANGWTPVVEGPSCSIFSNGNKAGAIAAFPAERPGVTRAVVIRQR